MDVRSLSSDELAKSLPALLSDERQVVSTFLVRLAEFDRRRQYEASGQPGLWEYCRQVLGLSDGMIFQRIHAARLIQRFPVAEHFLRDGRLSMTTLVLMRDLLKEENAHELFERASHRSKAEVELLVATMKTSAVQPRTMLRKAPPLRMVEVPALVFSPSESPSVSVPSTEGAGSPEQSPPFPDPVKAAPAPGPERAATILVPIPPRRPDVEMKPVAEDRFVVRLVVDREFTQKLEEASRLLSHRIPRKDLVAVLRAGLDAVLEREKKRRGAIQPASRVKKAGVARPERQATDPTSQAMGPKPRPTDPPQVQQTSQVQQVSVPARRPRASIPAEVRREVWQRDGGRCVWPMADGACCGSTWQVEIDHVIPHARGGASDPGGTRLLCRRHNQQHARECFGEKHIERAVTSSGKVPGRD